VTDVLKLKRSSQSRVQSMSGTLHCGDGSGYENDVEELFVCRNVSSSRGASRSSIGIGAKGEHMARVIPSHRVVNGPSQTARVTCDVCVIKVLISEINSDRHSCD
jgi:hypothetical protein